MKTKTKNQTFDQLMAQTDELIQRSEKFLEQNGRKYSLTDWVTLAEYKKRFGIKSTNVLSNWITRGIIPPENVLHIVELNDLRLIKAVPYHE